MRTYGRIYQRDTAGQIIPGSKGTWVKVETDAAGFDDMVWLVTLCQVLQLNLSESPFFADWGIPQQQSIVQQVFPDYNMMVTQQRFSQYFASVIVAKEELPTPTYKVNVITNRGERITSQIPV